MSNTPFYFIIAITTLFATGCDDPSPTTQPFAPLAQAPAPAEPSSDPPTLTADPSDECSLADEATDAMRRAAAFYHEKVASHGGYVYYYATDLSRRWGEGEATADQIWVQPPGTPTVGLAYLKALEATGDVNYFYAARDAAQALVYGQLKSGGWTNCVDFDPQGRRTSLYCPNNGFKTLAFRRLL